MIYHMIRGAAYVLKGVRSIIEHLAEIEVLQVVRSAYAHSIPFALPMTQSLGHLSSPCLSLLGQVFVYSKIYTSISSTGQSCS